MANHFPTLKLIGGFFLSQSLRPLPKKFVLNFCFVAFLALTTLFYQYICVYQETYITRLKGVYPTTFLETHGRIVDPLPGFRHEPEVFELTRSVPFRLCAEGQPCSLVDVGIRAIADGENRDLALMDTVTGKPLVAVNQALYEHLRQAPGFDGSGIYLVDREGKGHYVRIAPFDLLGDKGWLILPSSLAWALNYFPNVTTVYPIDPMADSKVVERYSASGLKLTLWSDRLPFFSSVFHLLLSSVFRWLMTGTLVLILILNIGFIKDTLREFKKLINFANLYGVNERLLHGAFSVLLTAWFAALFTVSYGFKCALNAYLAHAVPTLGELLVPAYYPAVLAGILLVLNLTILVYIRVLYRRKLVLTGA